MVRISQKVQVPEKPSDSSLLNNGSSLHTAAFFPINTEIPSSIFDIPVAIINRKSQPERYHYAFQNIKQAGFKIIKKFHAIDSYHSWYLHKYKLSLCRLDPIYYHKGKQGCFLSHYTLWKHMIEHDIPAIIIFEDDVYFHHVWKQLSQYLYSNTPKNFDFLYLGNSYCLFQSSQIIEKGPVLNTHAMLLTNRGAQKLIDFCHKEELPIKTLDVFLYELCVKYPTQLNWYTWDITKFQNFSSKDPIYTNFNGIVYQCQDFPSNCGSNVAIL